MKNYRPVSNLPFLSKILEKVVSRVLSEHRARNNLDIPLQSAYRQHHSTETVLLKVHNDVLRALDRRECVFLVLLDLSAAFDTVDHRQLKSRLEQQFGVSHSALLWLDSYLSNRQQAVTIRGIGSKKRTLKYGVPQGSVLGPELFKDYASPLASLIQSFGVSFHGYADDTQLYITFVPGRDEDIALDKIQRCIAAVKAWMAKIYHKLNDDKVYCHRFSMQSEEGSDRPYCCRGAHDRQVRTSQKHRRHLRQFSYYGSSSREDCTDSLVSPLFYW